MSPRCPLALAALAVLLLITAVPSSAQAALDDSPGCFFATNAFIKGCFAKVVEARCTGCLSCETGYYLEQTINPDASVAEGTCVEDTTSTDGCDNMTSTPIVGEVDPNVTDGTVPHYTHCLSCKSGYTLQWHTAVVAYVGVLNYGVCVKTTPSVLPEISASSGHSSTAPAVLVLLSALAAALLSAL